MAKSLSSKKKARKTSESSEVRKERAAKVLQLLKKEFPRPKTALLHENPFQLLIATILSAQCTDERVNMVTKELFKKYRAPGDFARANVAELEQEIRSTGFFRMKTKNIMACSQALVAQYGGQVPNTIEQLVLLPGVGRKTANVVLGQAFGITAGVVVDTHVHRLSQRLGFSDADDAEKVEQDLMALFPRRNWTDVGSILILHGRKTCNARSPRCDECRLASLCPSVSLFQGKAKTG